MTRAAVDQLLYLMDEAFGAPGQEHSLIRNLRAVAEDACLWSPPNGTRTIRNITAHVAACKIMYDNHAFGDASMGWDDPRWYQNRTREQMLDFLKEGHRRLREHVVALEDGDLLRKRRAPWGEMKGDPLAHLRHDSARPLSRR